MSIYDSSDTVLAKDFLTTLCLVDHSTKIKVIKYKFFNLILILMFMNLMKFLSKDDMSKVNVRMMNVIKVNVLVNFIKLIYLFFLVKNNLNIVVCVFEVLDFLNF